MKELNNKIIADIKTEEDLVNLIQKLDKEFDLEHTKFLLDTLTIIKGKKYSLKDKEFKIVSNPSNKFIDDWIFTNHSARFNRVLHLFINDKEQFAYVYTIIFNMKSKTYSTDPTQGNIQFAETEAKCEFNYLTRLK